MPKQVKKPENRKEVVMLMSEETMKKVQDAMVRMGWDNNPPNTFDRMVDLLILRGFDQSFSVEKPMGKGLTTVMGG